MQQNQQLIHPNNKQSWFVESALGMPKKCIRVKHFIVDLGNDSLAQQCKLDVL